MNRGTEVCEEKSMREVKQGMGIISKSVQDPMHPAEIFRRCFKIQRTLYQKVQENVLELKTTY